MGRVPLYSIAVSDRARAVRYTFMADQPDRSLRRMVTVITLPKVPKRRMTVEPILPSHPPSRRWVTTGMASRIVWPLRTSAALSGFSVVVLVMLNEESNDIAIV